MTVLLDVNLSPDWIEFLASHGFIAIHWSSIGDCNAPDTDIMAHAVKSNCLVLTQDLDYGTIPFNHERRANRSADSCRSGQPSNAWTSSHCGFASDSKEPAQEALITIEQKRNQVDSSANSKKPIAQNIPIGNIPTHKSISSCVPQKSHPSGRSGPLWNKTYHYETTATRAIEGRMKWLRCMKCLTLP